jgi:hypothetical protein
MKLLLSSGLFRFVSSQHSQIHADTPPRVLVGFALLFLGRLAAWYTPRRAWRWLPELATQFVVVVVVRFLPAALSFQFGRRLSVERIAIYKPVREVEQRKIVSKIGSTGDGIGNVVVRIRCVIYLVAPAALRRAFKPGDLIDQAIVARQADPMRVE